MQESTTTAFVAYHSSDGIQCAFPIVFSCFKHLKYECYNLVNEQVINQDLLLSFMFDLWVKSIDCFTQW